MGIPKPRERASGAAMILDEELGPDDKVREAVAALTSAAAKDPYTLRQALRNGQVLATQNQLLAATEFHGSDSNLGRASEILETFFRLRADTYVYYDPETTGKIQDGIRTVDIQEARYWRVDVYLGQMCLSLDGQTANLLPPPEQRGTFGMAA